MIDYQFRKLKNALDIDNRENRRSGKREKKKEKKLEGNFY